MNRLMRRYILQINMMDYAGAIWITAFNEVAEQLMGVPANDIQQLKVSSAHALMG
jgi:replication factor A1